jgi:hypothetical protein
VCDHALVEYATARTTLALADGRLEGFYSLAAQHADLSGPERAAAGVAADRRRVPATLMAWIARDPQASVTGRQLFLHAPTTEDQTEWRAPPPEQVIAHTNLYWTYQTAPGRTAGTSESKDIDFARES